MRALWLLLVSAPLLLFGGADFVLNNGQSAVFRFDAPPEKNAVLFFSARIKVPAPLEAWAVNSLRAELNGKVLSSPLNKGKTLIDPQSRPQAECPLFADGRLLVKADSDWEVFNAPAGSVYSNTWLLNQTNKTELSNVFYSFAFKLDQLKPVGNQVKFDVQLPAHLAAYPLEIKDVAVCGFDNRISFVRDWMQSVYPWSFPALSEIGETEIAMARNEHGFASFSIYCFAPQKFRLPELGEGFQLYRLDNSNIPAKLKEAEVRHIPNIGKPYVPELLTPLASGSEVDLPAGTTTFAVRLTQDKPGLYPVAGSPLSFRVLDITLPDANDLPVENSMYIMAGGTRTQNIYPEFKEYGMSFMLLSPWTAAIPMKIEDGRLTADFRKFDACIKEYQRNGMNCKTLFFGTSEPLLKQIAKLTGESEEGKEFQRRFKEFIILFFNHADELGLTVYLSLFDEANFQKAVWGKTKLLTAIAVTVPNSRLWSTVTELASAAHYYETLGYRRGRDMCITHPFQTYNKADDEILRGVLCPDKQVKDLRGRFVGEYESITSYPSANNRYAYGIRSRLGGIKYMMGFAFWWGNMYKENVKPTKCYYVSYPFREKTTNVRYSSVGWEAIRCGIDDMRYLTLAHQLLAQKYGDAVAVSRLDAICGKPLYSADELPLGRFSEVRKQLIDIIMENK